MIIVAGALHVEPTGRDRYVAGCREVVRLARAAPGCLDFAITADTVDPGRIDVYERWRTRGQKCRQRARQRCAGVRVEQWKAPHSHGLRPVGLRRRKPRREQHHRQVGHAEQVIHH